MSNGLLELEFDFFFVARSLEVNINKVNVNKVNVNKDNVNKVNVKVNVNKVNDKVNDIYSIHSHYKGGGLWPPPQKRCRGLRPRHLFCGFLCSGYE